MDCVISTPNHSKLYLLRADEIYFFLYVCRPENYWCTIKCPLELGRCIALKLPSLQISFVMVRDHVHEMYFFFLQFSIPCEYVSVWLLVDFLLVWSS